MARPRVKVTKVEAAVRAVHARGEYPSTQAIGRELGRSGDKFGLNDRERKIRDSVFLDLGLEAGRRGVWLTRERKACPCLTPRCKGCHIGEQLRLAMLKTELPSAFAKIEGLDK